MGTGFLLWVKCGRSVLLTTHQLSSAAVKEEWSYTSTHTLGHTGPVTGSLYLYLYLYCLYEDFNVIKTNETILVEADISCSDFHVIYPMIFMLYILKEIGGIETNIIVIL